MKRRATSPLHGRHFHSPAPPLASSSSTSSSSSAPHLPYMADAETLKAKGNTHFRNGEYDEAVRFYSLAIQRNSTNPVLWTNRANARLKLELWEDVITDCLRSIELNTENMKAFFYLGMFDNFVH